MAPARKPPVAVTSAEVGEALLHFAGLAAAQAGRGVTFGTVEASGFVEHPADPRSLKAVARATEILRKDRERVQAQAAKIILGPLHDALVPIFVAATDDQTILESIEEHVAQRLLDRGYQVDREQIAAFIVNRGDFKTHSGPGRGAWGPSQAAAYSLTKALKWGAGTRVNKAKVDAKKQPLLPGPLNRWVSPREVRAFVNGLLEVEERQGQTLPTLPLEALRSGEHTGALIARAVHDSKERIGQELDRGHDELRAIFASVFRGEDPFSHFNLPTGGKEAWARLRQQCDAIRAIPEVAERPWLLEMLTASLAELMASVVKAYFTEALDLQSESPEATLSTAPYTS